MSQIVHGWRRMPHAKSAVTGCILAFCISCSAWRCARRCMRELWDAYVFEYQCTVMCITSRQLACMHACIWGLSIHLYTSLCVVSAAICALSVPSFAIVHASTVCRFQSTYLLSASHTCTMHSRCTLSKSAIASVGGTLAVASPQSPCTCTCCKVRRTCIHVWYAVGMLVDTSNAGAARPQ